MKNCYSRAVGALIICVVAVVFGHGCGETERSRGKKAQAANSDAAPLANRPKVQRFGSVVGLRPEKKDRYNDLHAHPWPEINAMLKTCNVRNYSIYETEIDGRLFLFSYFEYVGDDLKADMAKMAADPKTKEWWKETDPCQIRLSGTPEGQQWKSIQEVYHLD